jgi:ankyrin repeat protein
LVGIENIASTPEGFTVCTPRYDAMPRISINNLPSLMLFSFLRLHSMTHYHHCHSYTPILTNEAVEPINVLFGHSNQDLVSRMARHESQGNAESASALVHCADWVQYLTGDRYPNLDNASDSTTFEIDIPSELSSVSRNGENSRLLLSIIHSAANNLLSESQASEMLSLVLQDSNRKIFLSLIAGQSPATKAIARTFLPAAIHTLDCSLVSTLLDTGISRDAYVNRSRRRPLVIAIRGQSMEMTELLLDLGADANFSFETYGSDDANTPLKAAVQTGRLDLVQLLLRAQAHVNDPDPRHGVSALCIASRTGSMQLVQLLLDAGADVNGLPRSGFLPETALQAAAGSGNIEILQLLLSYGAAVNSRWDLEGALKRAASSGSVEIIQLLLLHGAVNYFPALMNAGEEQRGHVVNCLVHSWLTTDPLMGGDIGRTALWAATSCGDFELVQILLLLGAPADGDTIWPTALHAAARLGDIKIAELLMSYGADVNAPATTFVTTALQTAVHNNHMQIVQVLLSRGADVNATAADEGKMALAAAARRGNLEMLELLMEYGADMSTQGASVVISAVGRTSLVFLRLLLDAWTLANDGNLHWIVDEDSRTALEISVKTTDVDLTRLLLEYKADNTSLALREAIWPNEVTDEVNTEVVKLLLASGAEVGRLAGDHEGSDRSMTALERAVRFDHLTILGLLLDHQIGATTNDKSRALQVSAFVGNLGTARLLLDHGANVNAAPLSKCFGVLRTALQAAAGSSDVSMVRFLLEAGADVESKVPSEDEQGTALQFAAIAGSMSVVTLLTQKGANVKALAIGVHGRTALEGAAEHGRLDIVQLLLNLGAEVAGSRAIQFAREEGHDGVVALLEEA